MKKLLFLMALFALTGCLGMPDDLTPVKDFKVDAYLGKWYEIARLDHSFEQGLTQVTAEYSLRKDGGIKVVNRGYLAAKNEWKEAEGKAYFVDDENEGYLKVSFFGPFYGSYVVFELEKTGYEYAFVSGPNTDYLWLLSRTPKVSDRVKAEFEARAKQYGFNTEKLIYVEQK
jgi:apolipoprotein D and lipocalin family protein